MFRPAPRYQNSYEDRQTAALPSRKYVLQCTSTHTHKIMEAIHVDQLGHVVVVVVAVVVVVPVLVVVSSRSRSSGRGGRAGG